MVSWAEKYRPTSSKGILGNEESVIEFKDWLASWTERKPPKKTACLLVGPAGIGKTSLARAAANDLNFRVVEMNASDVRTEKAIATLLEPARTRTTLESFEGDHRGNLILIDEVDGVFGREDRGGLAAILSIIEKSPVPVVLTANNVENERFIDLMKSCLTIELHEIRPRVLKVLLAHILQEEGTDHESALIEQIAHTSHGDIRSAINDLQALIGSSQAHLHDRRTRELGEKETLEQLLGSHSLAEARRAIDATEIGLYRDDLLLELTDLLPYVYTSPDKLAWAYEQLSRVDVGYGRIGASRSRGMMPPPFNMPRRDAVPNWSLFPSVLNDLAQVGVQPLDESLDHAIEIAPRHCIKIPERYSYRLWQLDRLCSRIGRACHTSKRTSLREIVPFLVEICRLDEEEGRSIASTLGLEEQDIDFLFSSAKSGTMPSGEEEILDPIGFKLPYMGKDKFVQLMRAGVAYNRSNGKFFVRRLDNLDSIEERVSEIISKPIKFTRTQADETERQLDLVKECYIDEAKVECASCEYVEDCPTHAIATLKFCLCDSSLVDKDAYHKYVAKNAPLQAIAQPRKTVRRTTVHRKKTKAS